MGRDSLSGPFGGVGWRCGRGGEGADGGIGGRRDVGGAGVLARGFRGGRLAMSR